MNDDKIAGLRRSYKRTVLDTVDEKKSPILFFQEWLAEAIEQGQPEPNAMILATVDEYGAPSARTILLKGVTEKGFVFYTNYGSRKSREMSYTPKVALVFNWLKMERQVRIRGTVSRMSEEASDKYFQKRPRGSRLGAWASPQSQIIPEREQLEKNATHFEQLFSDQEVPIPPHWGGFLVEPLTIEFWQGRESRLHDRFIYSNKKGNWQAERLAP